MIKIFIHWLRVGGGFVLVLFLANFNESKVTKYTLPPAMLYHSGKTVNTIDKWEHVRREEILSLFEECVYGAYPKEKLVPDVEVLEEGSALNGLATRKQVRLTYTREGAELSLQLLIYIPMRPGQVAHIDGEKHPVMVTYNLEGNHTIIYDSVVIPSTVYSKRLPGVIKKFSENQRGKKNKKEHIPIERLIKKGYAVVTLYYGDVDPDYNDGFKNGMHALYPEYVGRDNYPGSISAWAWGLSRVADYLENEKSIDNKRISVFGFSRLGKVALWAAANDKRFKVVVTDSTGTGGAALARRNFGETIRLITYRFPHWFTRSYATYAGRENELPIDQHQLLALIAPHVVLLSVATHDAWSDPKGEIKALESAKKVYDLYEAGRLHYVIHEGKHAVTEDEWDDYIAFLNSHL